MKKTKFRRGLEKLLFTGLLAGALANPLKAQVTEEAGFKAAMNPYSQPNIHMLEGRDSLDYYGSGDVVLNDTVDFRDAEAIRNGTESGNDRADVNGDGVVDNTDATMIEEYLNGNITYLPGKDWNHLNRQERIDWATKIIEIDKTNERSYISGVYDCTSFSRELASINSFGVENNESDIYYDLFAEDGDDNARFNIPMYQAATIAGSQTQEQIETSPAGHRIVTVLVGPETGERYSEDPLDFSHWYFVEPQADNHVVPGDWSMNENGHAEIKWFGYSPSYDLFWTKNLIKFELENGQVEEIRNIGNSLLLENPNAPDTIPPTANFPEDKTVSFSQGMNLESIIESTPPTNVSDNKDPSPVVSYTYETNQTSEGICSDVSYDAEVVWKVEDESGNFITDTSHIYVRDEEKPEVNNIPENRKVEYSTDLNLNDYLNLNNLQATDNSGLEVILEKSSKSTQLNDGTINQVRFAYVDTIKATDKCGNSQIYVVKQEVDDTQPVSGYLTDNYIRRESGQTPEDAIKSLISHEEDNSGLAVDTVITNTSENYYDVKLIDVAGNETYLGNAQADYPVGIEKRISPLEKVYPNPVRDDLNLEYNLINPGKVNVEIYNISGKLVEYSSEEGFSGENNLEMDVSNLKPGMYILNFKNDEKTYTEKFIKR